MSKTSHAKHEHKAHAQHEHQLSVESAPDEDFSKHHKALIWVAVIVLIVALPILFAALTLLRVVSW